MLAGTITEGEAHGTPLFIVPPPPAIIIPMENPQYSLTANALDGRIARAAAPLIRIDRAARRKEEEGASK